MNVGGWIMFLVSWVVILALVVFCYNRIMSAKHPHMHAPMDIDTESD